MSNKLFLGFAAILLLLLSFNYFYPSVLLAGLMCLDMLVFIIVFIYCEIN